MLSAPVQSRRPQMLSYSMAFYTHSGLLPYSALVCLFFFFLCHFPKFSYLNFSSVFFLHCFRVSYTRSRMSVGFIFWFSPSTRLWGYWLIYFLWIWSYAQSDVIQSAIVLEEEQCYAKNFIRTVLLGSHSDLADPRVLKTKSKAINTILRTLYSILRRTKTFSSSTIWNISLKAFFLQSNDNMKSWTQWQRKGEMPCLTADRQPWGYTSPYTFSVLASV